MAALSLTSRVASSFIQPAREKGSLSSSLLKPSPVSTSFGVKTCARVSCSLQDNLKELASKCSEAGKVAIVSLITSSLIVSGVNAEGPPKKLSYNELKGLTYMAVKGSGITTQCPMIKSGSDAVGLKLGTYQLKKLCLEHASFRVKAESQFKGGVLDFQPTKLMTRLKFEEQDGSTILQLMFTSLGFICRTPISIPKLDLHVMKLMPAAQQRHLKT